MKKNINQILDYKNFIFLLIGLSFIIRLVAIYFYHDKQLDQEWEILLNNLIKYKAYTYYGPPIPHVILPPLYPFFLYFLNIFVFANADLLSITIFTQIILSTISIYIFYKINQKIFSDVYSLISASIFSFFPLNIYAAGQTSSITLQIFLSLLFILLLFNLTEKQSKKEIIYLSLISGLLILTRGEFILIYGATLFYLFLKNKIKLINIFIIILCTFLVVSPYLIRNYNTFNQITVAKALGFNLWKGNNQLSTVEGYGDFNLGFYNVAEIRNEKNLNFKNPIFKNLNDKINILKKDKFYEINKDSVFLEEALKNLNEDFLKYLKLFFKKILSFYFVDLSSTYLSYYSFLHFIPALVIGILSFPGLILILKEKDFKIRYLGAYLLLTIVIFSIFFILPRYKLTILPIQIILTVYFAKYVFKKLNKNHGHK